MLSFLTAFAHILRCNSVRKQMMSPWLSTNVSGPTDLVDEERADAFAARLIPCARHDQVHVRRAAAADERLAACRRGGTCQQ